MAEYAPYRRSPPPKLLSEPPNVELNLESKTLSLWCLNYVWSLKVQITVTTVKTTVPHGFFALVVWETVDAILAQFDESTRSSAEGHQECCQR